MTTTTRPERQLGGAPGGDTTRVSPLSRVATVLTRPTVYLPLLNLVLFLLVWEFVGRQIDPLLFAPPSRVLAAFVGLVASGELLRATATTVNTLVVGFALSVAIGIPLGVLLGRQPALGRVLDPYLDAVYATPRVVIVPLVVLWFGVGYSGRVFLILLGTTIPIIVSTAIGVRNTRRDLMEVATAFGASGRQMVRHVQLPGAVPFVASGLRIGAERAIVGVVIGEIFLELTGIGGFIQINAQGFRTAEMLCGVLVIGIIGVVFIGLLDMLERRVSAWKASG